jgi:hypothetical protein
MRLKWILAGAGFAMAVLIWTVWPKNDIFLPEDLVGYWVTSAPKYQDRFFELSRVSVVFGTGRDSIDVNFIEAVERRTQGDKTTYTIHYKNTKGLEGRLSFVWDPSNKGKIRLRNQEDMVWEKTMHAL